MLPSVETWNPHTPTPCVTSSSVSTPADTTSLTTQPLSLYTGASDMVSYTRTPLPYATLLFFSNSPWLSVLSTLAEHSALVIFFSSPLRGESLMVESGIGGGGYHEGSGAGERWVVIN